MNKKTVDILSICIIFLLVISSMVTAQTATNNKEVVKSDSNNRAYNGHLRVYVVEPVSRWNNYDDEPYHFAFLDFAIDEELSIAFQDTFTKQVTWNAEDAGYSDVTENNIMVIAAVFNPLSYLSYAYPPFKNPFDAYYVDAAAAATPGTTGYNTANEEFTHTVFCEEATATWCKYCPITAEALKNVYETHEYPFYFVALVADKSSTAYSRLTNDYNIYGYPTCFFDGGYKVLVGSTNENSIINNILQCGQRDVHELNLSVSLNWVGNGVIDISISITNNEEMPDNLPPETPDIEGPTKGKIKEEQQFTFVSSDPEKQKIYYFIDWGDETNTGWIGPYYSGEKISINHTWVKRDTYLIKAKVKDPEDAESNWGTLEFTASRFKNNIFRSIIERLNILNNLLEKLGFLK